MQQRHHVTIRATARRQQTAELLLQGCGAEEIAGRLGCSVRTAQRLAREVQPLLASLRHERLVRLADRLSTVTATAIEALMDLLEHGPPALRLRAAITVLAESRQWLEQGAMAERMQALEERLVELEAIVAAGRPTARA